MDIIDNHGTNIGSLDVAVSNEKSITINRIRNITVVTVRDRDTGKANTATFIGDSPFGN